MNSSLGAPNIKTRTACLTSTLMQTDIRDILKKHWGFPAFRPLQEEIITSVLSGRDTLALLPTGGGKSICFQVPALAKPGLCLVISPLIALMKDQVYHLHRKGIRSAAIFSGMSSREIDVTLDNCAYGDIKLLYVSPERLRTEMFLERLPKLNVNLLAVDEAHCISQWGYDFRPPYLQIAEIRPVLKGVPVLALTASATKQVEQDIMEKLQFNSNTVFRKSFARENLSYVVFYEENKMKRLMSVIKNVRGTGIVYLRSRRGTEEIARILQTNGVPADFYHAGMESTERSRKQEDWIKNRTRVIVCTNAFGMGIDKPDVRFVVHLNLPDSPEAYYQEAGRAGRDGKRSYAVTLYDHADVRGLERNITEQFPTPDEVRRTYQALGNYLQLPIGAGEGESYDFDLMSFSKTYELPLAKTHQALKLLQSQGLISLSDAVLLSPRVKFIVSNEALYRFEVEHEKLEPLIKTLLRSHAGLFDHFVKIDETRLAERLGMTKENLQRTLSYLEKAGIIYYEPLKNEPQVTFLTPRYDGRDMPLDVRAMTERQEVQKEKIEAMIRYARNTVRCRSQELLAYFGEMSTSPCGICDMCLSRKRFDMSDKHFDDLSTRISDTLRQTPLHPDQLASSLAGEKPDDVMQVLRWMIDHRLVKENSSEELIWQE